MDPTRITQEIPALVYQKIDTMSPEELDTLPFGTIQLDERGTILQFNAYESELAGMVRGAVLGKNFFTDVAPCTNVRDFHGRFVEGVHRKQLREKFRYHFAFKQKPRNVLVTLFYSNVTESVWVMIQPMD